MSTKEPVLNGTRATADLPSSEHKRNVGGSDSYGLCVYTSAWHAAIWQDVRELFEFRRYMERRPGGSYPTKFKATLEAYCRERQVPVPAYLQHEGGDAAVLELALRTGRMPCVTYAGVDGAGRYGGQAIAHMVNLVHMDDARAAIVDNNFPGSWLWMTRDQFLNRWRGLSDAGRPLYAGRQPVGGGWCIVFLAAPPAPYPAEPVAFGAAPPCVCGDSCRCKPGECPAKCPVSYGQCANGRCNIPAPYVIPPLANTAPAPPGFPADPGPPPASNFVWGVRPDTGRPGWVVTDAPAAAAAAADPFPGGVDSGKLADRSAYWLNGKAVTKAQALEAMQLTDDSDRWNLSVVGDGLLVEKVRRDVQQLPAAVRGRLHVQTYAPGSWQASQFRLDPGVTLRAPDGKDGDRTARTIGSLTPEAYAYTTLAVLLQQPGGPDARPQPAPTPKPVDPAPGPKVDPTPPPPPAPTPAPQPSPGPSWLALILSAILAWLFARR